MTNPRVSVIIPSYQCDRYVAEAVGSVLIQSGCTFEILVIDDGSTDHTANVIDTLVSAQSQRNKGMIQYVFQDNQGVCAARNHGLRLAKGEFVVFLDADDYFLPSKLRLQVAVFDQNPSLGIVHTGWLRVDQDGHEIRSVNPWENIPYLTLKSWIRYKPVLPSAMMFRREWLEKVGGFDQTYQVAEDVELVLRLSLAGCQSAWLRAVTVADRQHPTNTMKNGLVQSRDVQRLMEQFFASPNLPASLKLIEQESRYNTLVWIACYLCYTGNASDMMAVLKKAFDFSPYLPMATVVNWLESYREFLKNQDTECDVTMMTQSQEWQQLCHWVVQEASLKCKRGK